MEVVASLSQGRTAAAQCGLFTHKSVPVIFEPPCTLSVRCVNNIFKTCYRYSIVILGGEGEIGNIRYTRCSQKNGDIFSLYPSTNLGSFATKN